MTTADKPLAPQPIEKLSSQLEVSESLSFLCMLDLLLLLLLVVLSLQGIHGNPLSETQKVTG